MNEETKTEPVHTEPSLVWTRVLAYFAFFHFASYSLLVGEVSEVVMYFDLAVIICWAVGGNGRAALVDMARAWKGGK